MLTFCKKVIAVNTNKTIDCLLIAIEICKMKHT